MTTLTTGTYELIEIPLANSDDDSTMPTQTYGEIVTPGLAITPGLWGDGIPRFNGGWDVTHVGSGTRISGGRTLHCLACVRDYAAAAIRSGIDWTLPQPEITAILNARGEQVEGLFDALRELRTCLGTQCDRGIDFGNMPGF